METWNQNDLRRVSRVSQGFEPNGVVWGQSRFKSHGVAEAQKMFEPNRIEWRQS